MGDLIFAKAVAKGQRRMTSENFALALTYVADKKGVELDLVQSAIAYSEGPVLHATRADPVRLHDDKSTYTGTHANGGPESVAVGVGSLTEQSWKRHSGRNNSGSSTPRRPTL